MIPIPIIGTAINAIAGFFTKKQEIKKATITAKAKLEASRLEGNQSIEMTDAEWEALTLQTQTGSWKDEYVTIIITSPIVLLVAGSLWYAITGDIRLLEGAQKGIQELQTLGLDMNFLTTSVVLAAIGLKVWRA